MVDGVCTSETGIIFNGRTSTRVDVGIYIMARYEYCISETHSSRVTKTCALSPNGPVLRK